MSTSHAGRLLVATPSLSDPNFARTVVLLIAHSEEGAFGIVLNRPMEGVPVSDHLPVWAEHAASPAVLFAGGPVERSAAIGLASIEAEAPASGCTEVIPGLAIIDLESGPDALGDGFRRMRVFAGYAGWGAGQLEGEIGQSAWFVVDSTADDPFSDEPAGLWSVVLGRQPGRLAMFAFYPTEPRAN